MEGARKSCDHREMHVYMMIAPMQYSKRFYEYIIAAFDACDVKSSSLVQRFVFQNFERNRLVGEIDSSRSSHLTPDRHFVAGTLRPYRPTRFPWMML